MAHHNLLQLCGFNFNQTFDLIYKASQDGFSAESFHKHCDYKEGTLIIVKTTGDFIFGGYTEKDWSGCCYKSDRNAFIFSLVNRDNSPIKIKCSIGEKAIGCNPKYGPIFGYKNPDFVLFDHSNANADNFSNLCNSYIHPLYVQRSAEARSFLAGECNFQTIEIEAFYKN